MVEKLMKHLKKSIDNDKPFGHVRRFQLIQIAHNPHDTFGIEKYMTINAFTLTQSLCTG